MSQKDALLFEEGFLFMNVRILLIAMADRERRIYEEAIRGLGVEVSAVPSLKDLDGVVKDLYFHGVVIDMPSKIDSLKNDREFIYSTLRKFPAAHVSLEKESRQIRVFYPGQEPGAILLDFINDKCLMTILLFLNPKILTIIRHCFLTSF